MKFANTQFGIQSLLPSPASDSEKESALLSNRINNRRGFLEIHHPKKKAFKTPNTVFIPPEKWLASV